MLFARLPINLLSVLYAFVYHLKEYTSLFWYHLIIIVNNNNLSSSLNSNLKWNSCINYLKYEIYLYGCKVARQSDKQTNRHGVLVKILVNKQQS